MVDIDKTFVIAH